ncbi:MAG: hypothetical protein ABW170_04900 [Candidatus Thiodiazotropha sp. L084R]
MFSGTSTAGNATLVAYGGINDSYGGRIIFYDKSSGGASKIKLSSNGELDISSHTNGITIGSLELTGGVIRIQLGNNLTNLSVSGELCINSTHTDFDFKNQKQGGFVFNKAYKILTNTKLASFTTAQFRGSSIEGVEPAFSIEGNDLYVEFIKK